MVDLEFKSINAETIVMIIPCKVITENIPKRVVVHPGVDKFVKNFSIKTMDVENNMKNINDPKK